MKRIFKFKKGQSTDWDESIIHFLEDKLTPEFEKSGLFRFNNDYKVTVIIEKIKR